MDADEWVAKNLGYDRRAARVDKAIRATARQVQFDSGASHAEQRGALSKRLNALRDRAAEMAKLAPIDAYQAFNDLLVPIARQVTARDWPAAETAIAQAEQRIDTLLPACKTWNALRQRIEPAAKRLDEQILLLADDEFQALNGQLKLLRQAIYAGGVEAQPLKLAGEQADAFDKALTDRIEAAKARKTRIELLLIEREMLARSVDAAADRATAADLPDVADALQKSRLALDGLTAKSGETALTQALKDARSAHDRDLLLIEAKEREIELALRRERLEEVGRQHDALVLQHADSLDGAVPSLRQAVDDQQEELTALRDAADPDAVDDAEAALQELQVAYQSMLDEMRPIVRLQTRLRRMLTEYDAFTKEDKKVNPDAWNQLEKEHGMLPEVLTDNDPDSAEWKTADEWYGFELGAFLAKFSAFNAKAEAANRRDAYDEAVADRKALATAYAARRRNATPAHIGRAKTAFDALTLLLERSAEEIEEGAELNEAGQTKAETLFDELRALNLEIDAHLKAQRTVAKELDTADGGHAMQRHGPEVETEKISKRVTTGYSPDGTWSPTKKSGQFLNYDLFLDTRTAAFAYAETNYFAVFGPKLDKAPASLDEVFAFTMAHGKQVGAGFEGEGAAQRVAGKSGEIYASVKATVLRNTFTKIIWDAGKTRWVAIQHFPS